VVVLLENANVGQISNRMRNFVLNAVPLNQQHQQHLLPAMAKKIALAADPL